MREKIEFTIVMLSNAAIGYYLASFYGPMALIVYSIIAVFLVALVCEIHCRRRMNRKH